MKRWWMVAVVLVLAALAPARAPERGLRLRVTGPGVVGIRWPELPHQQFPFRLSQKQYGSYTLECWTDGRAGFRLRRGEEVLYEARGRGDRCRASDYGELLGPGKKALIVLEEGGADWYWANVHVFQLEPDFREIARWDLCPYPRLNDLDGDGRLELVCVDMDVELEYWKFHPRVIFRLTERGFEPAPDLMRSREVEPPRDLLQRLATRQRLLKEGVPAGPDWTRCAAIPMIYGGKADAAHALVVRYGGNWDQLIGSLRGSPYWSLLQELNQDQVFKF